MLLKQLVFRNSLSLRPGIFLYVLNFCLIEIGGFGRLSGRMAGHKNERQS